MAMIMHAVVRSFTVCHMSITMAVACHAQPVVHTWFIDLLHVTH